MKIAYVTSLYPAVSHTFILNEIAALRRLGVEIGTFSIRRARASDILGAAARDEAENTRSILPLNPVNAVSSLAWCAFRRFGPLADVLRRMVFAAGSLKGSVKWLAYTVEGIALARWIVDGGYEHLHCHFGNSGSHTAWIAARIANVPFSITCHGSELNDPLGFRLPEKARSAAFIACVSKFGRARLMHASSREYWNKYHVVRCGISETTPDPYPEPGKQEREILCVGRLSVEKGHFILLDAFEALLRKIPGVRLVLVGDGPLRSELERRCQELADPSSVTFTGSLDPAAVAERIARASLVALASFSEGVPVVLMEAFSHGRPVVATRVGGIPELVIHGQNGLLVSPGDAGELADAMGFVLSDPDEASRMGARGFAAVRAEFDETKSALGLKSLFETAVAEPLRINGGSYA